MKQSGHGCLIAVAVVVVAIALTAFGLAWRYAWAGPSGKVAAREDILSGGSRIVNYEHFFNLCAAVQSYEAALEASYRELAVTKDQDNIERLQTNITALTAQRARAINQYNADARKSYTQGQFRSSQLPFEIPNPLYEKGDQTSCVA